MDSGSGSNAARARHDTEHKQTRIEFQDQEFVTARNSC
jgi:hypothetical protein